MKRCRGSSRPWRAHVISGFILCTIISIVESGEMWPLERPEGMPSIQSLEVMCGKDHMDVHLSFSHPFEGIVSSKGQHGDPRCVYVPPSTGQTFFSFRIAYARCGTKPDLHGQFYENTVVVQYDKDLLEVWDEAKRLRCEWFNDYEKTASKPPMVIADLDVIQLDFRGDNVDCWMEIQHGKGPWAPPVSGIVPLGSTLTLVVAINDYRGEFDMRVKSCAASDGGGHIIHLSDEYGCVLRPKMISRFLKARASDERASVITYAFFHAFKFPDALSVHIKCKVEICRHGCLDHCQQSGGEIPNETHHLGAYVGAQDRNDQHLSTASSNRSPLPPGSPDPASSDDSNSADSDLLMYDDIIQHGDEVASFGEQFPGLPKKPSAQAQHHRPSSDRYDPLKAHLDIQPRPIMEHMLQDRFPHGPRNLDTEIPLVVGPRSFDANVGPIETETKPRPRSMDEPVVGTPSPSVETPKAKRRRRAVVVSDRKVRSADVGVSGLYEVISEADLAFSPDNRAEAVTVFQGRIREEVVYGICLPVPGFSALFVLVSVSAVVSALVAGSLLYRYQMQREHLAQHHSQQHNHVTNSLTSWMSMRLLRVRACPNTSAPAPSSSSTTVNTVLNNKKTANNHDNHEG